MLQYKLTNIVVSNVTNDLIFELGVCELECLIFVKSELF